MKLAKFGDLKNMRWRDEQCINPWCLLAVQCGDPASRRSDRGFGALFIDGLVGHQEVVDSGPHHFL